MSQSATIYRVSQDTFRELNKPDNKQPFQTSSAKSSATFHGSFIGLEYILSKGQDSSTSELISKIFSPAQHLGGQDFESLTPQEQFELYERGLLIHYLNPETIFKISEILDKISETDFNLKYDAGELNDNHIYPCAWHNDNSPKYAFNEQHIAVDFKNLKTIFKEAAQEKDCLFVFVG